MPRRKCFISYKTDDAPYKHFIQDHLDIDMIDKSLNEPINSTNPDYIMRVIREQHLCDSTVTIFLIGTHSAETLGYSEQQFIKRELQASLYRGQKNTRNGILGVVLPEMHDRIYLDLHTCPICGSKTRTIILTDETVIKEFRENYFIRSDGKCCWSEEDRYCVLVDWDSFKTNPEAYIEKAYDKRSSPVAERVVVYP